MTDILHKYSCNKFISPAVVEVTYLATKSIPNNSFNKLQVLNFYDPQDNFSWVKMRKRKI